MGLHVGSPLPQLDGVELWLNREPTTEMPGERATLVYFWALSCPACKANMPELNALRTQYAESGVRFIGVHSPRTPTDIDDDKVKQIADEIGVSDACALDNLGLLAARFELGGLWPHYFVFDSQRKMRRRGAGGLGLKLMAPALKMLTSRA